jgi:hypothetical protein
MGAEIFWLVSGFPAIAAEPVKRIPRTTNGLLVKMLGNLFLRMHFV